MALYYEVREIRNDTIHKDNGEVRLRSYITDSQKETLQNVLLYYFIKCDKMTGLHLVKYVHAIYEDKYQIWSRFSKAKGRLERFARPTRYLGLLILIM